MKSDPDTWVEVSEAAIDAQRVMAFVAHESAGAISSFIGTTRDNFDGKCVVQLEYEAYVPMAEKELRNVAQQMREKWPSVVKIALVHRLGIVKVKEASVIIAVSSPHRHASLEACAFAIDALKASAPIWKKERYDDGQCSSTCQGNGGNAEWKVNTEWKGPAK